MRHNVKIVAVALMVLGCGAAAGVAQQVGSGTGIFEGHGDVGVTPRQGSVVYDGGDYRVTGGGANIWSTTDAFQFAWRRLSGDVTLTADVRFDGAGKVNHRKAVLMIRQGLEAGAAYADVALHGDGLTSLQFRPKAGAETEEVKAEVNAPRRIRIERRGNAFTMFAGNSGEELKAAGTAAVVLQDPVYVGIGVCSHDAEIVEAAIFSNVQLAANTSGDQLAVVTDVPAVPAAVPQKDRARDRKKSRVSIYDLGSKSIRVLYESDKVFEAPNWSLDGKYLLSNSGGNLFRIPLDGAGAGEPQKIDLGSISRCNNDHGISQDGKWLALSASPGRGESQVFLASIDGAHPRLMTPKAPSYFHGWSPDGRWLAFVGQRNGIFNLYRVAATGGEEERLTSQAAYDDGPDYSPDGNWIYFNSNRSGNWDIWRMPAEGAGTADERAQQVTWDELEDWFPHPSPDGKWMVFLSFPKGTEGHDAEMEVSLRMMPLPGAKIEPAAIQVLGKVFGGQGTINVNSWSPDSKKFAFVSYELAKPAR